MKSKIITFLSLITLFVSCNKWLDVTSDMEIPSDKHFETPTGFKDAVIGTYINMSQPELYSKTMTWDMMEFLSQNYASVSGANNATIADYNYVTEPFIGYRDDIWLGVYNVIANVNNILKYEEQNKDVMTPILDSLVRGEMLGMRAFLHFDLLRMFGKGNLGNRPELMSERSIPYQLHYDKDVPDQLTYRKYIDQLLADADEAIEYLNVDPMKCGGLDKPQGHYAGETTGNFLTTSASSRRYRMNYYAAMATKARILMWDGSEESKTMALEVAEEVLDTIWRPSSVTWVQAGNVGRGNYYQSDVVFKDEHIFAIKKDDLLGVQGVLFDASSPNNMYDVVFLNQNKVNEIYEQPSELDSDWRYSHCIHGEGTEMANYSLYKLRQHEDHDDQYKDIIPLIRISEIYYIAAECRMMPGPNYDRLKALEYLNKVRNNRNIPSNLDLGPELTDEEIMDEITKEYRKELVGEGQLFYYFKRLGLDMPGYNKPMTDIEYQFPMPDDELIIGNR